MVASPGPTPAPARPIPIALCALVLFLAAGCSAPWRSSVRPGISTASFHGWRQATRLSNGLVTATCVPTIGGRILEYSLADTNFLFIGRDELGATPGSRRAGPHPYFGGAFARLHPERKWVAVAAGRASAIALGSYKTRPLPAEGGALALELASPPDLATRTAVNRKLELFPHSTRLRLTTTVANASPAPAEWGIHTVLQLRGCARRDGITHRDDAPSGRLSLYIPADPRHGVRVLGERSSPAARQWDHASLPGILVLRYGRQLSKAQVQPSLPWVALTDATSGCVFVQKLACERKDLLAAGPPLIPYPFIEVACFGPVTVLKPGQATSLVEEWFACRCPPPVVDVTPAGVVSSPLSLLRGAGKLWLEGRFGVFYEGKAAIVFRDGAGKDLQRLDCGPVGPLQAVELNRQVALPPRTARIALEVSDAAGKPVGNLGTIILGK